MTGPATQLTLVLAESDSRVTPGIPTLTAAPGLSLVAPLQGPAASVRGAGAAGSFSGEVGKHPEVTAAGSTAVVGRVARGLGPGRLTDGVGQGEQVVTGRADVVEVDLVPDDLPTARHGQPLGVELAQVVAVRLGERRQRADNGRRLRVHVGQSRRCRLRAAAARAAT